MLSYGSLCGILHMPVGVDVVAEFTTLVGSLYWAENSVHLFPDSFRTAVLNNPSNQVGSSPIKRDAPQLQDQISQDYINYRCTVFIKRPCQIRSSFLIYLICGCLFALAMNDNLLYDFYARRHTRYPVFLW